MPVSLADARAILDAAVEGDRDRCCDEPRGDERRGDLLAFRRMDGAKLVAASIARDTAYTAESVEKPSAALKEGSEPSGDVHGLQSTDDGRIVTFGGGIRLDHGGSVVGAVGCSGGDVSEDIEFRGLPVSAIIPCTTRIRGDRRCGRLVEPFPACPLLRVIWVRARSRADGSFGPGPAMADDLRDRYRADGVEISRDRWRNATRSHHLAVDLRKLRGGVRPIAPPHALFGGTPSTLRWPGRTDRN